MNFTAGNLAVIIDAYNPENIGKVVKVLRAQTMRERLRIRNHGKVWIVHSSVKLTWNMWGKYFHENFGPVPECQMQPLRSCDFYEWLKQCPPEKTSCFTHVMKEHEERANQRRLEMTDLTKCEF